MSKKTKRGVRKKPARKRVRNHAAEYARRIERGLATGKTRAHARGHAKSDERPRPRGSEFVIANRPEERALASMRKGSSLKAAAHEHHISTERLRRYLGENVKAERQGRRWVIGDERPRKFPIYSAGELKSPVMAPEEASRAGQFMNAAKRFVLTGRKKLLAPWEDSGVVDIGGAFHPFETDPDELYELANAGELSFPEMYKIANY
jgi:hypothetical protein